MAIFMNIKIIHTLIKVLLIKPDHKAWAYVTEKRWIEHPGE